MRSLSRLLLWLAVLIWALLLLWLLAHQFRGT
jgi:hypothetical protein